MAQKAMKEFHEFSIFLSKILFIHFQLPMRLAARKLTAAPVLGRAYKRSPSMQHLLFAISGTYWSYSDTSESRTFPTSYLPLFYFVSQYKTFHLTIDPTVCSYLCSASGFIKLPSRFPVMC
ncbi:hypothetical protein RB195_026277 [Necator americanus]|uniref:Uncharacterized protein n=1 Tax=Necator americanus TaxID=51031 RepID=A0ABR1EW97_NECAM